MSAVRTRPEIHTWRSLTARGTQVTTTRSWTSPRYPAGSAGAVPDHHRTDALLTQLSRSTC